MEGKRLLRSIKLQNILSYGPDAAELPLEPLNVLIGPNASGKSNLIEALSILAAAPRDLRVPIREGGGVSDWLWKGGQETPTATIDVMVDYLVNDLRYQISFGEAGGRFQLVDETIEGNRGENPPFTFYGYNHGNIVLHADETVFAYTNSGQSTQILPDQSILSQRRDPLIYPQLTYLADQFAGIQLYREWSLGRDAAPRSPQKTDMPEDFLLESASNLGMVLNDLQNRPKVKRALLSYLRKFYHRTTDIATKVHAGTVQILIHEEGLRDPVPATRLSDGTLRFLSLLTILCHPEPPPVVCIEEPELGLHPDIIPLVAELLVEASSRTQLFVTTHSDALVDALNDHPEAFVVCERREQGTELRRLQPDQLREWLENYRLGELWQMGEIGGNP
jgi:predicted ATPase